MIIVSAIEAPRRITKGTAGAFPYCGTVILGSLEVLVGLRLE
jgi:hypothetical protein